MTKLSRIDSSSSSLKYSVRTDASRWRKMMISAAFVLRFDRARTGTLYRASGSKVVSRRVYWQAGGGRVSIPSACCRVCRPEQFSS